MSQAIGRNVVVGLYNESTYGSPSGITSGEKAYIRQNGLTGAIARAVDETLAGFRGMPQSIASNKDVTGGLQVTVAPESIPKLLKHTLGLDTTTYAVARKTTNLITGVEVLRAQATSASGNGTLAFTQATGMLTWAEQGAVAGAGQNISSGGDFTLVSGTTSKTITVRVTAALLPGSNQNDTVDVEAGTTFLHRFTPAGTLPEGLLVEVNLGSEITLAHRYIRYLGCRVATARLSFNPQGFVDGNFDIRGANFNNDSGAALDASLDDFGHVGFSMFNASIELDGTSYADATTVEITFDNDLDDSLFVIGGGGVRGAMPAGFFKCNGTLTALFKDATLLNKAIAGTAGSLKIELKNGTGDGSAGNEALIIRVPDLLFTAKTPGVEGPRGLKLPLEFMSHRPNAAESRVEAALYTTRAVAAI